MLKWGPNSVTFKILISFRIAKANIEGCVVSCSLEVPKRKINETELVKATRDKSQRALRMFHDNSKEGNGVIFYDRTVQTQDKNSDELLSLG